MFTRKEAIAIAALFALVEAAGAAEWPEKPVRIIFPYAAGSTGDGTARIIARHLSDSFKTPFLVENRVGANGVVGTEAVARSAPDGHTLLWAVTPQMAISPVMTKVPYDPAKDFAPISAVSTNNFALVVNGKLPITSVAEFTQYVRSKEAGTFAYAEGGAGSITHLAMAMFLHRASLKGTNVSYRGTAPAITDVVAGHLPAMFALFGDALSHAQNGSVRMLAVASDKRSAQAPAIPTIAESGFPGFRAISWWGLMAPANTPKSTVGRIANAVAAATRDKTIIDQLTKFGVEPLGNGADEFAAMISADIVFWAEAVRTAGLEGK